MRRVFAVSAIALVLLIVGSVMALGQMEKPKQPSTNEVARQWVSTQKLPVVVPSSDVPPGSLKTVMDNLWGEGMKVCAIVRECLVGVTGVNLALRYEQIKAAQNLAQIWARGMSNLCVASVAYDGTNRTTRQFGIGCVLVASTIFTGKLATGEIALKMPVVATSLPNMAAQSEPVSGNKR